MRATAAVSSRRGKRTFAVSLLAAVVFLAAAPSVRADTGPASEAAPTDAGQSASAADAPGSAPDGPGNSGEAPGHAADGPGNSGDAPGHDPNGPGNSENAPGHQADQGTSIDQGATASASADQGNVGNTHVTVRVDEPGNGSPVGQENRAEAQADAGTSAAAETPGEASITQDVHADSSATQSDVSNTAVVVRVGSPGDDGAVSQSNVAAAGATAAGDQPGAQEAAEASAAQSGVANSSVSVRVFSPGDDGPVTQVNEASAAADAAGSGGAEDASASQDGARNTSVSIRVESSGTTGPVSQSNSVTENAVVVEPGAEIAVGVTDDGLDTVVAVAVDGDSLERPGVSGLEVWEWTWVWQRDESESVETWLGTTVDSWTWTWDGTGHGTVTTRAAGDDDANRAGGSWSWSWEWDRQGMAGWSWQWEWNATLSCGTCIWIWNWSWGWTGEPTESSAQAAGNGDVGNGPAGQVNTVRADAEATAVAEAGQAASQGGSGNGTQYAGQLIEVAQTVEADATAVQSGVASVSWDDATSQANVVTSGAAAVLETAVAQDVEQVLLAGDLATGDQWSGQQIDIVQVGHAEATASQRDAVLTRSGEHGAFGHAVVDNAADVEQASAQAGIVDGGSLEQSNAQLALVEQTADAERNGRPDRDGAFEGDRRHRLRVRLGRRARPCRPGRRPGRSPQRRNGHPGRRPVGLRLAGGIGARDDGPAGGNRGAPPRLERRDGGRPRLDRSGRGPVVSRLGRRPPGEPAGVDRRPARDRNLDLERRYRRLGRRRELRGDAAGCHPVHRGRPGDGRWVESDELLLLSDGRLSVAVLGAARRGRARSFSTDVPAEVESAAPEEEPTLFRGRGSAAVPSRATSVARRSAPIAPHLGQPALGRPVTTLSVPPSTQARLDTRPGSSAGAGDAGREPPLPPAGDPPVWVSALAAAASGTGPTGIAAILLAFVLVPPVLLRAREGSVVRRPTGELAPVDVPV